MIQAADGDFYGVTINTASQSTNVVFKLTSGGTDSVFYSLAGADNLIQASSGNFYVASIFGVGPYGIIGESGGVEEIDPTGTLIASQLFSGSNAGFPPVSGMIESPGGNIYLAVESGFGSDPGAVMVFTPGGTISTLYAFSAPNGYGINSDGADPMSMILGRDGNLYGTTDKGGVNGHGTIFQLTLAGGLTILHDNTEDDEPDGSAPRLRAQGTDGTFYATTDSEILSFTPANGLSVLHTFVFNYGAYIDVDGYSLTSLIQGRDGNFYGTADIGGTNGAGTVFEFNPAVRPGTIEFPVSFYQTQTPETAGSVTLTVQRVGGSTGAVAVTYATSNGGAVAGTDYTATTGTLSWADGDAADKTITIPILDRQLYNGSTKAFTVTLSNATGGATVGPAFGTTTIASVDILDSDSVPTPIPTPTPAPSPTPLAAPVITSATVISAQIDLPFAYQTTATNGPTSFAASGLPAGLTLDPATGTISGAPTLAGIFPITLSAVNVAGSGVTSLALTVFAPTITAASGNGAVVEGGAAGAIFVSRTGDTSLPLTVSYKAKGAAVAGVDYKKLPGSVIIPAGAVKTKIKVKPLAGLAGAGTLKLKVQLLAPTDGSYVVGTGTAKLKLIGP